ncbi:uncharacterized protein [Dysidea avara]|uniref:uncharacterized protein isoform X2 n=1 Tax=Dysidea avara TaxID=196820 RepID=UPI00332E5E58
MESIWIMVIMLVAVVCAAKEAKVHGNVLIKQDDAGDDAPLPLFAQSVMCQNAPQSSYPYCDYNLDLLSRTNDLVGRLNITEMIDQTSSIAPAISRLGINAYNWRSNCLHGWSKSGGSWGDLHWTVFPAPIGLSATFDTTLLNMAGKVTSDEGRALHNVMLQNNSGASPEAAGLNCFSPNVNLFRDPRWGRGQETYGEDPYLLSMLGVAYTRGLQEGTDSKYLKVAACAKHYAVHSGPEEIRMQFIANVSLYDLYDTYLPAFQSQVMAANVAQIMPAYSGVRVTDLSDKGAPDCANSYLLRTVLRDGFDAPNISVCSDNGGVYFVYDPHMYVNSTELSAAVSMNASTDLDLGTDKVYTTNLQKAIDDHLVEEETIREAVWRNFYLRMRLGDFDPPSKVSYQSIGEDHLDTADNQALNLEAAVKSIVLLKNKDDFLPLSVSSLKKIAIIGPLANSTTVPLSSYEGIPSKIVNIQDGITNYLSPNTTVSSIKGCYGVFCPTTLGFSEAVDAAEDADCVFMVMGLDQFIENEGKDRGEYTCWLSANRSAIGLPGCQHDLISAIEEVNDNIVLILLNGGPLTIVEEDQSDKIRAIVEAFYPGPLGGTAVAKVLFGEVSPAGRMPVMVVESDKDVPPSVDYNMATNPGRTYRYFTKSVLYPFGYGLTYTKFEYSDLKITPKSIAACDSVVVSVKVQNTGL